MPYVGTSRAARRESALLVSMYLLYYVLTNEWLLLILIILNRTIKALNVNLISIALLELWLYKILAL